MAQAHKQQTLPYALFERACTELSLNPGTLCYELGYAKNTYSGWAKVGQMPKTAALAIECLKRRQGRDKARRWYAISIADTQLSTVKTVVHSLGCRLSEALPLE